MSSDHDQPQSHPSPQSEDNVMSLMLSIADTTWRMFTPPAILVPMGIFADLKYGTKPWITILTAIIGLSISVLLVKKQLRQGR